MSANLSVDIGDPTPPYEQLRRQLVSMIEAGQLAAGERLPPLRQLARDLGLAVGTVGRSYRGLESAGLVVSRRGAGTRVADRPPVPAPESGLLREAHAYVARAAQLGFDRPAALAAFEQAWKG